MSDDAKSQYLVGYEAAIRSALAEINKMLEERDSDDYALLVHVYNRLYDMQGLDEPAPAERLMQARIDHLHSALETIKLQGDEHSRAIAEVGLFGREVIFTAEQNRQAWADWEQHDRGQRPGPPMDDIDLAIRRGREIGNMVVGSGKLAVFDETPTKDMREAWDGIEAMKAEKEAAKTG